MIHMGTFDEDEFPIEDQAQATAAVATEEPQAAAEPTGQTVTAPAEATEAPAESTPAEGDAEKAAAEAKAKADKEAADKAAAEAFEQYKTFVESVVAHEEVDKTTGTVPDGLKAEVRKAYSGLTGVKYKNAGRQFLQDRMHENMEQYNPADPSTAAAAVAARSFLELFKEVGKGVIKSESPVAKPVDPTEAHVARVAAALIAPNLILPPDGVSDGWQKQAQDKAAELAPQVQTYREWLKANANKTGDERAEEPEVDEIVKAAAKVALGRGLGAARKPRAAGEGKASTPFTGTRRNIQTHILEAFAAHPVGTWLSVADIAKFESSEYGTDHPSTGAVSARLFPKSGESTIPGIKGEIRDVKGGLKYAEPSAA